MAAMRMLRPDVAARLKREAMMYPHRDDYCELPLWSMARVDFEAKRP